MANPFTRQTRGSSDKCRRIVLETQGFLNTLGRLCLRCVRCGAIMEAARGGWHADHRKTVAEGGTDTADNLDCLCDDCHSDKTATEDVPRIAKGKRQRDKHFGVKRASGFRKPPPGYTFSWKTKRYEKDED